MVSSKTGLSPYWSMIPDGQAHKHKEMTNPREWLSSVSDLMTGFQLDKEKSGPIEVHALLIGA